ncbi:hypothetical protein GOP47_0016030 [Adiantum capillus-veneris]|uniref:Uncharacterized protein n=1 Tax=Adiantum capillus-veneris TaxID=13818 RepID=A0A9D4ZC58_ADICA|nr:hypothetical protein GOP47_0016030 [Adiantum capillus-veneris]
MADEFVSKPPLRRQRSFSPPSAHSRTLCCCIGGGRRGRSLAESEFDECFRHCAGFFTSCASGGIRKANNCSSGDADDDEYDQDLLPYKTPSRFKLFCRKLKADARRNIQRQNGGSAMSGTSRFHYDALSYAMNFDDGTWAQTQDYEGNNVQMRLHSARFSSSIPKSALPPAIPSES